MSSKNASHASSPLGTPGSPTPCNSAAAAAILEEMPGGFPDLHLLQLDEYINAAFDLTGNLLDSFEDVTEEEKDAMEASPFGTSLHPIDHSL